ncbi:type I secretion system permease/ATPase [Endozoicomonas sp. OPT23]|uniref:type I secretion system permease/ATPase n=1 Tax=Endozoicomonas sp. OPT23 TaxID=2072845 RepID=UPI00129A9788|nr:type I secretion system permease/ATPase [Endozoicomonas sp. OPT23]MRI34748.1 type I secretion system permease/ATPase [Endozoicomonas sp. OPT23]
MGSNSPDSGLYCFILMLQYLQQTADPEALWHEFSTKEGRFDSTAILRAAKKLKVKARKINITPDRIEYFDFPCIAISNDGEFFIIAAIQDQKVLIQKTDKTPEKVTEEELWQQWSGEVILLTHRSILAGSKRKFDLSWFLPVLVKYRKVIREILLASLALQIFALFTPIIFQVVMDKVLVHHALKTLDVLAVGLLILIIFEITLEGLRSYLFAHTTSKMDIELGCNLFDHLLKLPLAFFQSRPVGQIVQRVRELENIRAFLTGNTLTVLLDILFSFVFFGVMYLYSPKLTLIVLASIPFYILISVLVTPEIRRRTEERFQRGAATQSFLTESLTGMETVKAMAVEPKIRQRWEEQLSAYVKATYRSSILGIYGGQSVQLVSKVVTMLLMWQGALQVIDGNMTVGELIAFNMFSGQVAAPILRLAQLWQEFLQFRVSMERLGDLLNTQTEPLQGMNRPSLPKLRGEIEFRQVIFRYEPGRPEALRNLNLMIPAGQSLGVAGLSGSGKSTLMKLIQRLYIPEQGRVYIDGNDLTLLDPAWLRRQIGVVMQENILFNRTVHDNIALANPSASMNRVIEAATLAGAHEFILELPHGYNTELGERGIGLSGGQCQRIAIARAILTNPAILIFDEATSALDYESERIIQQNMKKICAGRTVIIIAHRLSAIRDCDTIAVMDKGMIIEQGSHNELITTDGRYASLWKLQARGDTSHA